MSSSSTASSSLPTASPQQAGASSQGVASSSQGAASQHDDAEVDSTVSKLASPLLPDPNANRKERRQKTNLVVFAAGSIFLFAGSFYGWGPMQLLLEENGSFLPETCVEDSNGDCPEQTAALLNCRFVSQLTVLTGPLLGFVSDRYGGAALTYCFGVSTMIGLALLMVAVEFPGTAWDYVLYIAFVLMGLGSTCGGLLTTTTGVLFRDPTASNGTSKAQSRVISLLNSLFDAGAMTYLGLWGLEKVTNDQDENGINLVAILGGYLGVGVVCLGCYSWFFRIVERQGSECEESSDAKPSLDVKTKASTEKDRISQTEHTLPSRLSSTMAFQTSESVHASNIDESPDRREGTSDSKHIIIINQQISRLSPPCHIDEDEANVSTHMDPEAEVIPATRTSESLYTPISQRSVAQQLRCQAYILLSVLFSFHMVSNVWTLTTARDFLKHLGDDDYGNRYLSIFTLITPVSLLALPFVDVAIHSFGFAWALQGVNFLGMVHGIIKVSSTNLNVQILGFVVFSFFRCFLFAVTFSCLASFTSADATGRAVGIMYVVSGVASFVNIGLANLAVEKMNGDFFVPNLLFLVLTVPMIYVTHILGKALARDDRGRSVPEAQSLVPDDDGSKCIALCSNGNAK